MSRKTPRDEHRTGTNRHSRDTREHVDTASLSIDERMQSALKRGQLVQSELIKASHPRTAPQVAHILGVNEDEVESRRRGGDLFAVPTQAQGYLYPEWQFESDEMLRAVVHVLAELTVRDAWMRLAFFVRGNLYLGGNSPLAELRRGHVEDVLRAARSFGEQGAA